MVSDPDRSTLTAAERQAIRADDDSSPRGDPRRGALLRRSGRSTSPMTPWRRRLEHGVDALAPRAPGPIPRPVNPLTAELARLPREHARLHAQLATAAAVRAIQKKRALLVEPAWIPPSDAAS